MSNKNTAPPTLIFGLMLLIRPGRFGGTETRRATAARQFCEQESSELPRALSAPPVATHHTIYVAVPAVRPIHGRYVYMGTMHEPILRERDEREIQHQKASGGRTSVTIMPAIGPRKTVYPFMNDKKPVALRYFGISVLAG